MNLGFEAGEKATSSEKKIYKLFDFHTTLFEDPRDSLSIPSRSLRFPDIFKIYKDSQKQFDMSFFAPSKRQNWNCFLTFHFYKRTSVQCKLLFTLTYEPK